MPFTPSLPLKHVFKPNNSRLRKTRRNQGNTNTIEVDPQSYYTKIIVERDIFEPKIVRNTNDLIDNNCHFYLNQYDKILEVKNINLPCDGDKYKNAIVIKTNTEISGHTKNVLNRLLLDLMNKYKIFKSNVAISGSSKIIGHDAEKAFIALNRCTNLNITKDDYGLLSISGGETKNKFDKILLQVLSDAKIEVILLATNSNYVNEPNKVYLTVGAYRGNKQTNDGIIIAQPMVNMNHIKKATALAKKAGYSIMEGNYVAHEIIESYFSAKIQPNAKPIPDDTYIQAHQKACESDKNYIEPIIELVYSDVSRSTARGMVKFFDKNNPNYLHEAWLW